MNLFFYSIMEDTYKTVSKISEGLYKDKGSKFIAITYPVKIEEDVKNILKENKKKYYDARHHCYAYSLGHPNQKTRSFDDGEPSGTAGKPILNQITSFGITDVLILVVRYFGGTLLGTSGLVHAYKTATIDSIKNNLIIEKTISSIFSIYCNAETLQPVMNILKENNIHTSIEVAGSEWIVKADIRDALTNKITEKLQHLKSIEIKK